MTLIHPYQALLEELLNTKSLVYDEGGHQIYTSIRRTSLTREDLDSLIASGDLIQSGSTQTREIYALNPDSEWVSLQLKSVEKISPERINASVAMASDLHHLGSGKTDYPTDYDPTLLEAFPFQFEEDTVDDSTITIDCPEFTSLCPKTSQPDFARIIIRYRPRRKAVESKSLKLYLFSFRQHGAFHESVVQMIARDLISLLNPRELEVVGEFLPRGGISIHPKVHYKAS